MSISSNPYQGRPKSSFWKRSVVGAPNGIPLDLYKRKWPISKTDRIATAGSCFAQHIGRHLKYRGFTVLDMEPPPVYLPGAVHSNFGYSIYSARYGNLYTTRQLLQLAKEAFGEFQPVDIVWRHSDGGFVDALRPGIEPVGLDSENEVRAHRDQHLRAVRDLLLQAQVFVFTLGLTEAWMHAPSGTVYPTAPGTVAGEYDKQAHVFHNFSYQEIVDDFLAFRELIRQKGNTVCRFLLTVSPVPLAATATDRNVMVATQYSKAVLRAAAGFLSSTHEDIDYFPSYEIVVSPWSGIKAYEDDLRTVRPEVVNRIMDTFLFAHTGEAPASEVANNKLPESVGVARDFGGDVVCEEAILEAFGKDAR